MQTRLATRLVNLWEKLRKYETHWVEDLPSVTRKNSVYIVGGRKYPFIAAIVCPRKACCEVVQVEISQDDQSKWKIKEHDDGSISLSPSIYVTRLPCRCHYYFRKGKIVWTELPSIRVPRENRNLGCK